MRWVLLLLLTGCTVYDFPPPAEPDPIALRSPLAVQGGALKVVYSFEELRTAIADIIAGDAAEALDGFDVQTSNYTIVLGAPILFPETIEVPDTAWGITIVGAPGAFIYATEDIGAFFEVSGYHHRFERIYVTGNDDAELVTSFIELGDSVERLWVVDCFIGRATNLLYRASGSSFLRDFVVRGNMGGAIDLDELTRGIIEGNPRLGAVAISGGASNVIRGNTLLSNLVIDGGSANVIQGNAMSGSNITTSASSGSNVVSGNSLVGTVTAHGSDDTTGGNT